MQKDWSKVPDGSIHCDDVITYFQVVDNYVITPPEEKIDIFSVTEKTIPIWEPKVTLRPYEQLTKVYIDIETLRVPADTKDIREIARRGRIMAIGVRDEKGNNRLFRYDSEVRMLLELFEYLNKKQPDIILTFNGMKFDLPYIHHRAEANNLESLFWIGYDYDFSKFAAARIAGRPWDVPYRHVHCRFESGKKADHLDVYMLSIAWDSVLRKFTQYSLKSLPLQLGLRKEERLDLGIEGIEKCYETGDWETLEKYLTYDLEDTELLANFFSTSVYYQKTYFSEFTLQQLATFGNATKWNSVLEKYYGKGYTENLPEPVKYEYRGAIAFAVAGVHVDVAGCDFSGQYPSAMLQYGIHSEHDPDMVMLGVMKQAVDFRGTIKYKENLTQQDLDLATAVKPVINSAYGSLAAYVPYGDSLAAACVTLFARARLLWAKKFVENLGGVVVLMDTDSCYVTTEHTDIHLKYPISEDTLKKIPPDSSPRLLSAVSIIEQLKANIPSGAKLDLEAVNKILFVPPTTIPKDYNRNYKFSSVNGKKLVQKLFGTSREIIQYVENNFYDCRVTFDNLKKISDEFCLGFPHYESVRKNYIKLEWNAKKQSWDLKAKGRYVKRDRMQLEKTYQQRYLELYASSPESAEKYHQQLISDIVSGEYDVNLLTITRRIRIGEKTLVELGFGKPRDIISYYQGCEGIPVPLDAGIDYDIDFYLDKLLRLHEEIICLIPEKQNTQLSLSLNL